MGLFLLPFLFFNCVFGGLSSGITGYNGFTGSFLVNSNNAWQGYMDGQQRFFLAVNNFIYRWDFGTGNLTVPVTLSAAVPPNGLNASCAFGGEGAIVYRVPGRMFLLSHLQYGLYEVNMDTLACVQIHRFSSLPQLGMAVDPLTKDLIVGGYAIYRVTPGPNFGDPVLPNISTIYDNHLNVGQTADGITTGPDGTIYFANGYPRGVGIISGNQFLGVKLVVRNGQTLDPDGTAVSSDGKTLLINTNQGRLVLANLSDWTYTDVAFIGSGVYGDLGSVGADGCAYFSELNYDFMYKITPCIFGAGANHVDGECEFDTDCTSGNCTANHCVVVGVPHKCEVDSDCETLYCVNRTCQYAPVGNNCTQGYYCTSKNCTNGECSATHVHDPCQEDNDCTSENCNLTSHTCEVVPPTYPCTVNSDCTSASCILTCQVVHVNSSCTTNIDCTSHNCSTHICRVVVPGQDCQDDSDCSSYSCYSGTCIVVPVNHTCTYDNDCTSQNCAGLICRGNTGGGHCESNSDCNGANCDTGNKTCLTNGLGGQCLIDTDCKPPNLCADRKCKAPVTLNIMNLPIVTGQDNVWAIPSEEGLAGHDIQIRVISPNTPLPTGTIKFYEINPNPGAIGTTGVIPSGINNATVTLPWSTKSKLGVHNIQITYSGDGLHFGKNWTVNLVYFYFPVAGRFAISHTTALDSQAYFYGKDWQTKNFVIPVNESGGKNYIGYKTPSLVANNDMNCNFAQGLSQVDDHTTVVGYAWLGVPMVDRNDIKKGTARGVAKFGIIKVNPNVLPLPDTGEGGNPGGVGIGNLYGTFCSQGDPFLK